MIEKILEAFFRHWVLIILPLVVIPMDVVAWVFSVPPQYEAQAGVWVERPTYLAYTGDELTRYIPPATAQRNRLLELMRTRSFVTAIVAGSPLEYMLTSANGGGEMDQIFNRDFEVIQNGDHLLLIKFRSEQSQIAMRMVTAVVDEFRTRASEDRRAQAQLAISFYQARLSDSEAALSQARGELAKYLAANPKIALTLQQNGVEVARLDPTFADLQRKSDAVGRDADAARTSLQSAQLDVSAGNQSDAFGFRIVDAVGVSPSPSRQLKKLLVYPIAAVLIALVIGGSLLLLFAISDHSVRSLADLAPDAVILGILPRLKPSHITRAGGHATRRAVGFMAGAALPVQPPDRRAS
jgi:hypothetical protein